VRARRLAFYDWEADALTPAGKPVSAQLPQRDFRALLISQGSATAAPGTAAAGSMPLEAAVKLARAQRPAAGVSGSQRGTLEVPRGWTIVAATDPSGSVPHSTSGYFVIRDRVALSRSDVTHADAETDLRGDPDIVFDLTAHGGRSFQRLTAEIARRGAAFSTRDLAFNRHIAVVLDGKLLSVVHVDFRTYPDGIPTAHGVEITGGFSPLTAQQLAAEISAPPLPADLQLIDSTTFTRPGG